MNNTRKAEHNSYSIILQYIGFTKSATIINRPLRIFVVRINLATADDPPADDQEFTVTANK